jgi:hypothetical protein
MILSATLLLTLSAGPASAPSFQEAPSAPHEATIADAPLAEYRAELLELAFQMASALPLDPHVKDRSREQEAVAITCYELDQPRRAERYVEDIANWRRGAGYADLALYCARNGAPEEAERYLAQAAEVAAWPEAEIKQAWRRDRIRAKIASVYLLLGRAAEAAPFRADLEASQREAVEEVQAELIGNEEFQAWFRRVNALFASDDFDQTSAGLTALTRAYGRFYANEERRDLLEETIRGAWTKVPAQLHFDVAFSLAHEALGNGDEEKARNLAEEASQAFAETNLDPRASITIAAGLVDLRYRAGDVERARREADATLATFQEERERIVDVFRAELLIPLAEAYAAMGARETAVAVYDLAIAEGLVNVNSRPRVEDLGLACRSMAKHAVEPSEASWEILREIAPTLGHEFRSE